MPVIQHGRRDRREVCLSFDADLTAAMRARLHRGDVPSYADLRIVTVLEKADVPAVFFLTGLWMDEYPRQTVEIAAHRRFELGTHSQSHRGFSSGPYDLGLVPAGEVQAELRTPNATLEWLTGRRTSYFRFPGGYHSPDVLTTVEAAGMTVVHWDVDSGDAFCDDRQAVVDQVLTAVRPGSIILFHLGGPNAPQTANALPQILDGLRELDLTAVGLAELLRT